jgi:ribosomal protein S18 acetylase RimI-like enzyme
MVIREMKIEDIESIRSIAEHAWKDTYSSFIPVEIQEKVLKEAYSQEKMNERFRTYLMLVAENNYTEIMGYAFFSGDLDSNEAYLESLYIHPKHQGKGIGNALLLIGVSKFKNATSVSLSVYGGNPNISFYERQGFAFVKENKGEFFGHPMVFIEMKKVLT